MLNIESSARRAALVRWLLVWLLPVITKSDDASRHSTPVGLHFYYVGSVPSYIIHCATSIVCGVQLSACIKSVLSYMAT